MVAQVTLSHAPSDVGFIPEVDDIDAALLREPGHTLSALRVLLPKKGAP